MDDIVVQLRQREINDVANDPTVMARMLEIGNAAASEARAHGPRRTGRGAESIHAERYRDDGYNSVHISWTREYYYMYFHERGTRKLPARPFLVPSIEGRVR